ncbi:MAG: FGGY family carbohydrate kinase [Halobacillus sp.]|uniref:xylulokinase n=1 Tax=Halobacillus sp. TaxID=56800 RepID=UPI003BAFB271
MTYIAAFDLGTSALKGILLDRQGHRTSEQSLEIETNYGPNGEVEQQPEQWWQALQTILSIWQSTTPERVKAIRTVTFSGQMEDVIPLDSSGTASTAILYSDTRADQEARFIQSKKPFLSNITGNSIRSSTPLAKLLWMKKHQPSPYQYAKAFVFSAKDYLIYKLTNEAVTDPVTAATSGLMDLHERRWSEELLSDFSIDVNKMPRLLEPEQEAGKITDKVSQWTGFSVDTPVLCGSGDAGAATLGAGALHEGDLYLYLGTTGWAAAPTEKSANKIDGVFTLSHLPEGTNISIAPLLNAGNVHQWAVHTWGDQTKSPYANFEKLAAASPAGANGVLFLPYLHGERFPVMDPEATGAFVGLHPAVQKSDFARAVVEGLCFSCCQVIESLSEKHEGIMTVIGGGTRSRVWTQTLATILNRTIRVPNESEYSTVLGAASTAFISMGWVEDYAEFTEKYIDPQGAEVFTPAQENQETYRSQYERYLKLYPSLQGTYNN